MKVRTGLDFQGNEIKLATAERVGSLPEDNLFAGRMVVVLSEETVDDETINVGKYYYYNGKAWIPIEQQDIPDIPEINTFPGYAYYDPEDDNTKQITKWSEPDTTPGATDTKATDEHEHKDDFVTASEVANTLKNLRRFEDPTISNEEEHHGFPYYDANGQLQSFDATQKYNELQTVAPTGRPMVPKIATGGNINQHPYLVDTEYYHLTPSTVWSDVIPTSGCVIANIKNMASYILGIEDTDLGIGIFTTDSDGATQWTPITLPEDVTEAVVTVTETGLKTNKELVKTIDKNSTHNQIPTAKAVQAKIQKEITDDVDEENAVSGKGVKTYVDDKIEAIQASMSGDVGDGGDIPILSFNNESALPYSITNNDITPDTEVNPGQTGFQDNLFGGYTLTGPAMTYRNKVFNRIKLFIIRPGMVRVGIVRGTGKDCKDRIARGCFKASPRYDDIDDYPLTLLDDEEAQDTTCDGNSHTALKKWLVVKFCAYTGVQVFDFPDEIITSPHEYIYIECRSGVIGYMKNNTGTAIESNYGTVPNGTCHTGVAMNTNWVTWSDLQSGKYFLSKDMLCESAAFSHGMAGGTLQGSTAVQGFISDVWTCPDQNEYVNNNFMGILNIGIYKRGTTSDLTLNPLSEESWIPWSNAELVYKNRIVCGYGPKWEDQQKLAKTGLPIYAFEIILKTPGDLSMFLFSSNDPATCKILKHWTFRLRAIGKQFVHLPEDIILQEGQWIGFGGCTEAISVLAPDADTCFEEGTETLKAGYYDFAIPVYNQARANTFDNWVCFGDNALSGRHQNEGYYSSAIEDFSTHGFDYWTGVKYVPTTDAMRGYIDFSGAELKSDDGMNANINICLHTRTSKISKLEDLWCSVTGDSITTYRNVIPKKDDFVTNINEAGDYAICYPDAGSGQVNSMDNTWWGTLIKQTRMRFLINEAWSGSRVAGTESTTSSTACASSIRTSKLYNAIPTYQPNVNQKLGSPMAYPDIIFTMIGTNDLAGNTAAGAYSNTNVTSMDTILGAYETMVYRHKIKYPYAKRIYFIIPRGSNSFPYQNSNGFSISQFADAAEYICKAFGSYFVPLSYFAPLDSTYLDSSNCIWIPNGNWYRVPGKGSGNQNGYCDFLHPGPVGNQIIANGLQRFCENIL